MSRDFKQEYEQYMNELTPELWARIEKNLPAKEAENVQKISCGKKRKKHTGWAAFGISAVAAAVICVLAVPALQSAQDIRLNEGINFAGKMAYDDVLEAAEEAEEWGEAEREMEKRDASTIALSEEQLPESAAAQSANGIGQIQAEVEILEILEEDVTLYRARWEDKEVLLTFDTGFSKEVSLKKGESYCLLLQNAGAAVKWDYIIVEIK